SESLVVCEVDGDLVKKLREFRFRKETNNAAIIMKIDKERQLVILDEEHEDISPDELKDELPERQPRYPLHKPLYTLTNNYTTCTVINTSMMMEECLILFALSSPVQLELFGKGSLLFQTVPQCTKQGCKPEQQMMYAGSKNKLVQTVELTKVFEIRNTEDLTEEWLREKLGFFR
ncbi:hypothetical protein P4O66_013336, partial [Electrophorus voltai]